MNQPGICAVTLGLLLAMGMPSFSLANGSEDMSSSQTSSKVVLGWVENVRLMPGRTLMKAKLDTGAKSSALHAEDIEYFKKDGRDMVRFTVLKDHRDPDSERFIFERPLIREVNIKLRNTTIRDERPAVRLEFCIAGETHNTLFTLTKRSGFNYPILLGREFLQHEILVDSSESFTHRTRCPRS